VDRGGSRAPWRRTRVAGTRISIEFLLECLACGMTIHEIVEEYPTLTEEAISGMETAKLLARCFIAGFSED